MKKTGIIMTSLALLLASCSASELGMTGDNATDSLTTPTVHGLVTDQDGDPVEHIKVTLDWGEYALPDIVYTSSDGRFMAAAQVSGKNAVTLTLIFEDIDGEENGGVFDQLTDVVTLYPKETEDGEPVRFDLEYRLTLSTASESNPQS